MSTKILRRCCGASLGLLTTQVVVVNLENAYSTNDSMLAMLVKAGNESQLSVTLAIMSKKKRDEPPAMFKTAHAQT